MPSCVEERCLGSDFVRTLPEKRGATTWKKEHCLGLDFVRTGAFCNELLGNALVGITSISSNALVSISSSTLVS